MATVEERLLDWLRDAHAMEEQAETMLRREAQRLWDYPELRTRMEQHAEETRRQAERLRDCLQRYDAAPSGLKDTLGKMTGLGQALSGFLVGDEVVKAMLATATVEQMEIVSYKLLIEAAEAMGDSETKRVCDENLREEEAMAAWLEEHRSALLREYLQREEAA
jgi:ferritin-like metal-binding protein YciE